MRSIVRVSRRSRDVRASERGVTSTQRLQGRFGLGVSNCRAGQSVVDAVVEAELLGAEVAFVAEDIGCRDAFALLSLAAGRTETIRLFTGVVNPFTRTPISLAMGAATVNELSGGRAGVGLGTSSAALVTDRLGLAYVRPVRVMREATEALRLLWTNEPATYAGEVFRLSDAHLEVAVQGAQIPVFYAAMGQQMLRLAGRLADGVLLNVGASVEYVRWAVGQIAAGAESVNRDPREVTVAAWHTAYVGEDEEAGLTRARRWLAGTLSIPGQGELLLEHTGLSTEILAPIRELVSAYPHSGDPDRAAAHVPDEIARRLTLIGTPDTVAARIAEYRDAGVDVPVLAISALRALAARENVGTG
jgi:5,10-methylenetetrahydromethanopterin reductase